MQNHWTMTMCLVLLAAPAGWTAEMGPVLGDQLPPAGIATEVPKQHPPVYANALPPRTTCKPGDCAERPGCLSRIAHWFCYRSKQSTSVHELCQPYSYHPPIYLYFANNLIEGPGHAYPATPCNCWSSSCSSGVRMFSSPSAQNAGFLP